MKLALGLASKARFQTDPNPMVGAVLVDRFGKVLAEGYHQKAGSPHAEVEALQSFDTVPEASILFVTLEPCNFFGKTPPCTELILKKGVRRVVVGTRDPNPRVSGDGIAFLRSRGVEVLEGICEKECRELNRVFNTHIVKERPFVTVKTAMSLDGKIAMASGESQWITGKKAREAGHLLRSQHQAIAIGSQTLITDNPRLTDRVSEVPRQPRRVVFSSSGKIPADSHFTLNADTERFLVTGNRIPAERRESLQKLGVTVVEDTHLRPEIDASLKTLYRFGICSLLVEGGAELVASFIREKQVDCFVFYVSGKIIGSQQAPAWSGDLGIERLADIPHLHFDRIQKIGEDLLIIAYSAV